MSHLWPYLITGLSTGSIYGLAGTGLVLTYKTSGIFNFAHGTIAALVAYAFYDVHVRNGVPWLLAALICVLLLAPLLGLALERLAYRLADAPVVMKVVATVGILVGLQQLIIIRYGAAGIFMKSFLPTRTFRVLGLNVGVDQVIIMAVSLAGMIGLTLLFSSTRLGRSMQAVVDQPDLLALTGTSPAKVRRRAWYIGTAFAGLSGVLLAQSGLLDPLVLTLLVVQAFGAAAIGKFTSIPFTYLGALIVGILESLSTKYVGSVSWLRGVPPSVPFIVLFVVLVAAPRMWLLDFTIERKPKVIEPRQLPIGAKLIGGAALVFLVLRLPYIVGAHLPLYSSALGYVIIFLSLALLMRTSNQVSLAQLSFAAVGATTFGRLAAHAGLPWLLALLLGALAAVPIGALLAIPAIRRSGIYLALATFGFGIMLQYLIYPTSLMFGAGAGSVPAPRPSIATGDRAYYYVLLVFVVAVVGLISVLHRSRLGRLLRAMSDSPTALNTYGTSVTAIKVIVFCVSAFLAGLGGALLGPVTHGTSAGDFQPFGSLLLVVLAILVGGSEITSSVGAAIALMVVPGYITSLQAKNYLPLVFGASAVLVTMTQAGMEAPAWLSRAATNARRRPHRSPITVRLASRPEPGPL